MSLAGMRAKLLLLAWWSGLYLPPDRRVLERAIFPRLAEPDRCSRVLFVGVRFYTRRYARFFRETEFVTMDCDPRMARYGAKRHTVDRLENLVQHFSAGQFDAIVVNGVIGWGLDSREGVEAGLNACAHCLSTEGILVLGLNERRSATPDLKGLSVWRFFEQLNFPGLNTSRLVVAMPFDEREHTFVFLKKRPPTA
jgi:hypothetical protein